MTQKTYEGYFVIPFQGQMRFRVRAEKNSLAFENGDRTLDSFFSAVSGDRTSYNYHEETDDTRKQLTLQEVMGRRQGYLLQNLELLKKLVSSGDNEIKTEASFVVSYLGKFYTEKGLLMLKRVDNML